MSGSILFIGEDERSAATRYRAAHFFDRFRRDGWEVGFAPARGDRLGWLRLLPAIRRADVVVLLRRLPRWPMPGLIRGAARRLVYDFDDAIHAHEDGSDYPRRARRFAAILRLCDLVWAGNDELAAAARRWAGNVHVVPTAVDPAKYDLAPAKPAEGCDLVWIGSSATRRYLEAALPALEIAAGVVPGLRLRIVADFALPGDKLRVQAVPWSAASEAEALASAHVGIAPLPDNAWTRGKCGLKVLQCMAARLPMVASPTGVQPRMVEHGVTGCLAGTPAEWAEAIARLAGDPVLRARMGEAGRAKVLAEYSEDAAYTIMARTLADAMATRRP